jgi:putative sigma-54 modulation protein
MKINIIGHSFDVTPAIETYMKNKLERLSHHYDSILSVDVHFALEKLMQTVKATVHVKGNHFHADASEKDMYSAIDNLVDILDRQLMRHKEKLTNHRE